MDAISLIRQTREYLDYLEEHIQNVEKAWNEVKVKCKDMSFIYDDFYYFSLDELVKKHDVSKLSEEEFIQYRKHFFPLGKEKKGKLGQAWEHHKQNNLHHWENWTATEFYQPNEWAVHCAHMVIDWMAMGYKFGDTAQSYYEANKDKIILPDYAVRFIYRIFSRLEKEKQHV